MAEPLNISPESVSKSLLAKARVSPNEELIIDINSESGDMADHFEELPANLDEENIDDYKEGGYHPCQIGDSFKDGRYRISRKLGWGYFSTVWLATDTLRNDALVALKVVRAAQNYTETAIDEIKLLKKLSYSDPDHPGAQFVVKMHDQFFHIGPHGAHVCMVFEVLGENLLSLIKRYHYKGVPSIMVKQITLQMMLALDYAHRKCGIIHTDLKPENVLIRIRDVNFVMQQIREAETIQLRQDELLRQYGPDSQAQNLDDAAPFSKFSDELGTTPTGGAATPSPNYNDLGVKSLNVSSPSEQAELNSEMKGVSESTHTILSSDNHPNFTAAGVGSTDFSTDAFSSSTLTQENAQPETLTSDQIGNSWIPLKDGVEDAAANELISSGSSGEQLASANASVEKKSASIDTARSSISGESTGSYSSSTSLDRVRKVIVTGSQPLPSPLRKPENCRSISTNSLSSNSNDTYQRQQAPANATSANAAAGTRTLSSASQAENETFNTSSSQSGSNPEGCEAAGYPESIQPDDSEMNEIRRGSSGFTALEEEMITVSLADFGNSCSVDHHFTDDIQTRQYRAPEIITGTPWGAGVDCWSLACMIFELLTGDYLFEPQCSSTYSKDEDHLAQIIELLGPLPPYLQNGKYSSGYFDGRGRLRNIHKLKVWPLYDVFVGKYNYDPEEARQLSELLTSLLCLDPRERKDCGSLLHCEWLRNTPCFEDVNIDRVPQPNGMDIEGWASAVPQTKAECDLEVKASQDELDNMWVGGDSESVRHLES